MGEVMLQTLVIGGSVVGGLVLLLLMIFWGYSRLYKRAKPDEGLVRSGRGTIQACQGGGMWVIPMFHEFHCGSSRSRSTARARWLWLPRTRSVLM